MALPALASFVPALGHSLEGLRVVYVTPTLAEGAQLLMQVEGVIPTESKVYRAAGAQRVESPSGGTLRLLSLRGSLRGESLDLLYLPADVSDSFLEEVIPALIVRGGVIRYY